MVCSVCPKCQILHGALRWGSNIVALCPNCAVTNVEANDNLAAKYVASTFLCDWIWGSTGISSVPGALLRGWPMIRINWRQKWLKRCLLFFLIPRSPATQREVPVLLWVQLPIVSEHLRNSEDVSEVLSFQPWSCQGILCRSHSWSGSGLCEAFFTIASIFLGYLGRDTWFNCTTQETWTNVPLDILLLGLC